jgi:Ca2+-binding RTX toxin-like protein
VIKRNDSGGRIPSFDHSSSWKSASQNEGPTMIEVLLLFSFLIAGSVSFLSNDDDHEGDHLEDRDEDLDPDSSELSLIGEEKAEWIFATDEKVHLFGMDGDDSLMGSSTNDKLIGGEGDDCLLSEAGSDSVWGGSGNDQLLGGDGTDFLYGGDGNDTVWGDDDLEPSEDSLFGGKGDDIMFVGGMDVAYGGTGLDKFFVRCAYDGESIPEIKDYVRSQDELVVLYEPTTNPDPVLTVENSANSLTKTLMVDGVPILNVTGDALQAQEVKLRVIK